VQAVLRFPRTLLPLLDYVSPNLRELLAFAHLLAGGGADAFQVDEPGKPTPAAAALQLAQDSPQLLIPQSTACCGSF
jgi:hypothetical protein